MTRLPSLLRFAPFALYGWAVVVALSYFLSAWAIMEQAAYQFDSGSDAFGVLQNLVQSQAFVSGISEGAYMATNGALIHVLIAIYDKMKGVAA